MGMRFQKGQSPNFQKKFKLEYRNFGVLLPNLLAHSQHLGLRAIEHASSDPLLRELVRIIREFTLLVNVSVDLIPQLTRKFEEAASIVGGRHGDSGVRHVATWRRPNSREKSPGFEISSKAFCSGERVCRGGALVELSWKRRRPIEYKSTVFLPQSESLWTQYRVRKRAYYFN